MFLLICFLKICIELKKAFDMNNQLADVQAEISTNITSSYKDDRLIPFIGAGFSKNIRDYPGWKKFIAELEKDIDVKEGFFQKNFGEIRY